MNREQLAEHIVSTWHELSNQGQVVYRGVKDSVAPLFLQADGNTYSFLLQIKQSTKINLKKKEYKNILIDIVNAGLSYKNIIVTLRNQHFYDIFLQITEDIIISSMDLKNESDYVNVFTSHLNKWGNMFNKNPDETLSKEKQLGLYGELLFIKDMLDEGITPISIIESWKGPDGEDKDFQINGYGIEIKSSAKTNKIVIINNIRQLDDSGFTGLYLYYKSFAKTDSGQNTLPAIISGLRRLFLNTPALTEFELKLLRAGYRDEHAANYNSNYTLLTEAIYNVDNSFPRIVVGNVMNGILDVEYNLDLNLLSPYEISYQQLLSSLK